MGLLKDFKEFALKGNVIDLAVAVVIGASFNKIVTAVVDDLVMPFIGLLISKDGDWRDAGITLSRRGPVGPEGDLVVKYGDMIGVVLDFMIVAFVLFLIVRALKNAQVRLSKPVAAPTPTTRECPRCLELIPRKASRCKACTSDVEPMTATPT
jgi:large conductance mechanosensitive channel